MNIGSLGSSRQLVERGIAASTPHQFRDIAYMSHLSDPQGHIIELIQHTFEGDPLSAEADRNAPLGGGVQLGLITLRSTDIAADRQVCQDRFGMACLSRQAVTDLGFDLYFFAPTAERPPVQDVNAVENRAWLWQRPYTVLEFQHLVNTATALTPASEPPKLLITTATGHHTFSDFMRGGIPLAIIVWLTYTAYAYFMF